MTNQLLMTVWALCLVGVTSLASAQSQCLQNCADARDRCNVGACSGAGGQPLNGACLNIPNGRQQQYSSLLKQCSDTESRCEAGCPRALATGMVSERKRVFYSVVELPSGSARQVMANALNNKGVVVGSLQMPEQRGFIYDRGSFTVLEAAGPKGSSSLVAIDDFNRSVGNLSNDNTDQRVIIYESGKVTPAVAFTSTAISMNSRGVISGTDNQHAFLVENGRVTNRPEFVTVFVNDSGMLAGNLVGGGCELINGDSKKNLRPPGTGCGVTGLSNSGKVVGVSFVANVAHGFLYDNEGMHDLGTLAGAKEGSTSIARGLNDRGQVVGRSDTTGAQGNMRAFLYENGLMTDLNSLIPDSKTVLVEAVAINSSGQIIGLGARPGALGFASFLLTPKQ